MRAGWVLLLGLATMPVGACDRGGTDPQPPDQGATAADGTPEPTEAVDGVTPMAERVAVLGLLNKRNGIVRDLVLRPGQAVRVRDAIVRLRACETTAPWEREQLTGAFVQLDVQRPDKRWARVFSGWLYKESPSLNVIEHPAYDVWPKSCAMTYPAVPGSPPAPAASSNRSSAPNSADGAASPSSRPEAEAEVAPTAEPVPEPREIDPAPAPAAEPEAPPSAAESNAE